MSKLLEVVHKFRSGSLGSGGSHREGRKEGDGGTDDDAAQARPSVSSGSRTSSSSKLFATAASGDHSKGDRRGDTIWYVDHHQLPDPPKVDKAELSSLPLLSASGLQHTVLAALQQAGGGGISSNNKGLPTSPEKRPSKSRPKGTMDYKVKPSDTLARIAAVHDTTPTVLQNLNKMVSRFVFPGQTLIIPDPKYVPSEPSTPETTSPPVSPTTDNRPKLDVPLVKMADKSPEKVPGHAMKIPSPPVSATLPSPHPLSEEEARRLDEECYERFIKVCAKYVTESMGTVSGILLVTPNAVMFEPNLMDKLVEENGADTYSPTVFMDAILRAALYHDLSAMKFHMRSSSECSVTSDRSAVYRSDWRPRSASTSSLSQSSSGGTLTTQKVTASQSTSGFASRTTSGEKNSSGKQHLSVLQSSPSPGESSTDVELKDTMGDAGRETEGEIKIVGSGPSSVQKEETAVALEGAQTGETITDEGLTREANAYIRAPSPLITFDLSSPSEGGKMSEFSRSEQSPGEFVAASSQQLDGVDWTAGDVKATAEDLLSGGAGFDQLSLATALTPSQGTEHKKLSQDAVQEGEKTTASLKEEKLSPDDVFPEELSAPVQETGGALTPDSVGDGSGKRAQGPDQMSAAAPEALGSAHANGSGDNVKEMEESGGQLKGLVKEGDEMRIGNIVYLPVEESGNFPPQAGTQCRQTADSAPTPTSTTEPTQESMHIDDKNAGKDSLDGEDAGSRLSGSFRPLRTSAQHLSNFVNYATGLFRNTSEDRRDVQDAPPDAVKVPALATAEQKGRLASLTAKVSAPQPEARKRVFSAVRIEERPDLFQDLSNLITHPHEEDYSQPPMILYLHVDVDQNERQRLSSGSKGQVTKPHYLFGIPRSRVDNLYAFFVQWRPEIYGEQDREVDPQDQGFVVVEHTDVEGSEPIPSVSIVEEYFGPSAAASFKKDWELVSREEVRRRQSSVDTESSVMPEMSEESGIMTPHHILKLSDSLPPRTIGYTWTLVYSTALHGFSLKRLYRDVGRLDSPILLVLQDTADIVFGGFLSHPPKTSDHFFGNGTSLLFTFKDGFQVFTWTGDNTFFIKGNEDSLSVGAGHGQFGLWLDGDLYHGRSHRCETFANCVLSSEEDFFVKGMEVWAFE